MNSALKYFCHSLCTAALSVALAGCATTPPENVATNTATNSVNAATNAASAPAPGAKTINFTNSSVGLQGKLKDNYVDFSFKFPASWELKETGRSANAQNFVKVERGLSDESKGDFTLENFAVGYFSTTGDPAKDAVLLPKLVAQLSNQFASGFPKYKKVSEGQTKIGNLTGYEFRFQSVMDKTSRGPLTLWGRAVLLPNPDSKKGVALIMLASSLAPEIKSAGDVGEKGQLPIILDSFKFEKIGSPKKPVP